MQQPDTSTSCQLPLWQARSQAPWRYTHACTWPITNGQGVLRTREMQLPPSATSPVRLSVCQARLPSCSRSLCLCIPSTPEERLLDTLKPPSSSLARSPISNRHSCNGRLIYATASCSLQLMVRATPPSPSLSPSHATKPNAAPHDASKHLTPWHATPATPLNTQPLEYL